MSKITSRDWPSDVKVILGTATTYAPLQMTDQSIHALAKRGYTLAELAETFNVAGNTILAHHGDAFRAGKLALSEKPRLALQRIIDHFMDDDPVTGGPIPLAHEKTPTHNLLKAIELHFKKYEGLGKPEAIVPQADELISPADIKFQPLTAANKDEPW